MWSRPRFFVSAPLMVFPLLLALTAATASCPDDDEPQRPDVEAWTPEVSYLTPEAQGPRGFLDRRGLIHAHSPYSHDACDGEPVLDNGERDPVCFDDFRRGLCESKHDFVFLTDHPDGMTEYEFPEVLLYRSERGDQLIEREGEPVANIITECDREVTLMGGFEGGTMSVGLERHPIALEERRAVYGSGEAESIALMKANGAVVLKEHTENQTVEELSNPDLDGFEMFNLHANTLLGIGPILEVGIRMSEGDTEVCHPDLLGLHIISEDDRYLERWATVLSAGHKKVTTMGTDCHRNTLPGLTEDGERIDSYRRMMRMFSNHLLVRPEDDGTYDDRHLKEALKAGRLYGAFEIMGYPVGFDYYAEADGDRITEMGGSQSMTLGPRLVAKMPTIQNVDPDAPAPRMTMRILRAAATEWVEVASGNGDLDFEPDAPGAYRAEVRMLPSHLTDPLRADAKLLLERRFEENPDLKDWVWIYSNPIYIDG